MPQIHPRKPSPGELAEQQRLAAYWLHRESKLRPGKSPNRNTLALRPSRFALSEWAAQND